jgi:hypothetical protein
MKRTPAGQGQDFGLALAIREIEDPGARSKGCFFQDMNAVINRCEESRGIESRAEPRGTKETVCGRRLMGIFGGILAGSDELQKL